MSIKRVLFLVLILAGCSHQGTQNSDELVSIQIQDRNGFTETISVKDRLSTFDKTDFLVAQPYQKVVRVYGKTGVGKSSKITTYHSNGQPWQYLEIENGRAHGRFTEWYANGKIKVEACVIEGTPDVSEMAQLTWVFDGPSQAFDEQGRRIAQILYEKGFLEGIAQYFYADGTLFKSIPYHQDEIDGTLQIFDTTGNRIEKMTFNQGERDGASIAYWSPDQLKYSEEYTKGLLMKAEYFDPQGKKVAEIDDGEGTQVIFEEKMLASRLEYHRGIQEGKVENFDASGQLVSLYHIKDGVKNGDEWEYYPSNTQQPKLCLQWDDDLIQGVCKTWYENGVLESQREMNNNKKHGSAFAWFKDGDLMLMEEYEEDRLVKGSYYKKSERRPVSKVENGKGIATLFDKNGKILKRVVYEKGLPQKEA